MAGLGPAIHDTMPADAPLLSWMPGARWARRPAALNDFIFKAIPEMIPRGRNTGMAGARRAL
jgi:hypothetical protein